MAKLAGLPHSLHNSVHPARGPAVHDAEAAGAAFVRARSAIVHHTRCVGLRRRHRAEGIALAVYSAGRNCCAKMSVWASLKRITSPSVTCRERDLAPENQMPVRPPTINVTPFSLLLCQVARQFKMERPFCDALSNAFKESEIPITFVVVDIENRPDVQKDPDFAEVMQDKTRHKFIFTASTPDRFKVLRSKLLVDNKHLSFFGDLTKVKDAADTHLAMLTQAMFMLSQYRGRRLDRFVIFSNDHMFRTVANSIAVRQNIAARSQQNMLPPSATPSVLLHNGPAVGKNARSL
jgi:hypothetical protein